MSVYILTMKSSHMGRKDDLELMLTGH